MTVSYTYMRYFGHTCYPHPLSWWVSITDLSPLGRVSMRDCLDGAGLWACLWGIIFIALTDMGRPNLEMLGSFPWLELLTVLGTHVFISLHTWRCLWCDRLLLVAAWNLGLWATTNPFFPRRWAVGNGEERVTHSSKFPGGPRRLQQCLWQLPPSFVLLALQPFPSQVTTESHLAFDPHVPNN